MKKETLQPAGKFNHCASVIQFTDGIMVAHYAGSRECEDDQHVVLHINEGGQWSDPIELESRTGNPILFKSGDDVYAAYSRFERDHPQPVKKWMYCSSWCRKIADEIGEPMPMYRHPRLGYLFRSAPVYHNGKVLLPVYREENCYGTIHEWLGDRLKLIGRIGFGCNSVMQPSLWYDGEAWHVLCRNHQPHVFGPYAWHSTSVDLIHWSHPMLEKTIDNYDNSLVVINDGKKNPLIVWNAGKNRSDLRLGKLDDHSLGRSYVTLNEGGYGAYPNHCFDGMGNLHLVWTDLHNDQMVIKHMEFNKDEFLTLRD